MNIESKFICIIMWVFYEVYLDISLDHNFFIAIIQPMLEERPAETHANRWDLWFSGLSQINNKVKRKA